jgi:hypothetical protein
MAVTGRGREDAMQEMRPELVRGPGGGPLAVVWHVAEARDDGMLCGARLPATTAANWQDYRERWCAPCQDAFRWLVADHREEGAQRSGRAHPTG